MILHRQQFPIEIKAWFLLSFVVLELKTDFFFLLLLFKFDSFTLSVAKQQKL